VCNEFYHFICSSIRNTALWKIIKLSKQKWSCNKCKSETKTIIQNLENLSQEKNLGVTCSNDNLKGLTESSVNFMSDKFDKIAKHIQDVISSLK